MSHGPKPRRLLILGGTAEARELAAAAAENPRLSVTTSLAGRTAAPPALAGQTRVGGFGGADGLAAYLAEARIDVVIDATHPFAATISRHAAGACAATGVPRLQILRPPWQAQAGDRWIEVADNAAAAAALAGLGDRVFLTVGRQELTAYADLPEHWFLVRLVEPPAAALPLARHETVIGRAPFAEAGERALMSHHGIEVLVSKNSGGPATYGKIAAARSLELPVVMIARPAVPPGTKAANLEQALAWLDLHIR